MTTTELQKLLDTVAGSIDSVEKLIPPATIDEILAILNNVTSDTINFLLPLVQITNPKMTAAQLLQIVGTMKETLTMLKKMETDGSFAKISSLCRSLENRTFVLSIIARFL